nr:hypothetical protein [Tanacetum cinerariifolium]
MDSVDTKEKIIKHVGIVWVTVEGLPVKALTRNTFAKIVSSWGELVDTNDSDASSLSPIRVCVKTKPHVLINDMIKIIIKGQLHLICVKELEAWTPEFKTDTEEDYNSDGKSEGTHENDMGTEDPSGIYKLLKRNKDLPAGSGSSSQPIPQFPLGFTLVVEDNNVGSGNSPQPTYVGCQKDCFNPDNSKSGNKVNVSIVNSEHKHGTKFQASGSPLEVMDELIKMNFLSLNVQGLGNKAKQGWIQELNTRHRVNLVAIQEMKMDNIDLFAIKKVLENVSFDYVLALPLVTLGSWSSIKGFDKMVKDSWKNYDNMDSNSILNLKNKLHSLKTAIKLWLAEDNKKSNANKQTIMSRLTILDKSFDPGRLDSKAKIWWAIEVDKTSKFFHGIINKKRSQLAIHGVLVDGDWIVNPSLVKNEFLKHFANRFACSGEFCKGEEYDRELLEIGKEGVVLVGGGEGEDDIENLKRGDGFSSEDVIEMKRNDYYI